MTESSTLFIFVLALFLRCLSFLVGQNFDDVKTLFMQSDGGLTPVNSFRGSRAILSGPAGGVVGYASTSYGDVARQGVDSGGGRDEDRARFRGADDEDAPAVIGFDMGGTSTGTLEFWFWSRALKTRNRVTVCRMPGPR